MTRQFVHTTSISAPAAFAFAWHENPGAFARLVPPWETLEVEEQHGCLKDGGRTVFALRVGPAWQRWVAEHFDYVPGSQFCDRQISGPFREWRHVHSFQETGPESCQIVDTVDYAPPLEKVVPSGFVERKIKGVFRYRSAVVKNDIERHYAARLEKKKVLISGSSGLIGSQLVPFLESGGHEVIRLTRSRKRSSGKTIVWNPKEGFRDDQLKQLEGIDVVINLAGENIFGLWTKEKKRKIEESRVNTTRHLAEAIARLDRKPELYISGSAIGIYGDRGDEQLTERSLEGRGFLAEVGRKWEKATAAAENAGIRVVHLRTSVVLTPAGGALEKMLKAFRFGAGGRIGSGKQYMSWITTDDLLYLILHCMSAPTVRGAVNASTPEPIRNGDFTRVLAKVLRRPAVMHVPKFVLQTVMGDMAEEMLLASARVIPQASLDSGFQFAHPRLEEALRHVLGR